MKIRLLNDGFYKTLSHLSFPIEVDAVASSVEPDEDQEQEHKGYRVLRNELKRIGYIGEAPVSLFFYARECEVVRPEQCSTIERMIIVLNGPPGCGKDTLARLLTAYGFTRTEFKHDLYVKTAETYKVSLEEFKERHENRELKELPFKQGLSTRQMLIHVSENVCKPTYGQDYFGRLAAARCAEIKGDIVFSDGGFEAEIKPLGDNVIVIRLHREGFTFDGDSRNYLSEGIDVTLIDDNPNAAVKEILHHARNYRTR